MQGIRSISGSAELCDSNAGKTEQMKELGKAKITAKDILSFPKGTVVNIAELEEGEETATGADAEGGELVAYIAIGDSSHDVDVTEGDFVFISA